MADETPTAVEPVLGLAVEPAIEPADDPAVAGNREPEPSVRQASETWESLFRAQVGIMRRIREDRAFRDLPIREYDVLFNLSRCPTGWTRLNELNHHLLISQPSLSRMVDRLEARNLVRRRPAAADHRGIELALTEEGRALQRRIGSSHVHRIREVLAPVLDPGEMDQLKALTDKINARLGA
ncbi:DNA-binding MarR family transcriptional regulator [Arthrobacter sp. CAN_A2]|uniref:MarR family winged helix-turn-helix transcriptional regulator n=1 Tax=Arthrobacter sp. CAN_A2 TaxID=2787718 RepID=UPI0018F028E4